MKPPMSRSTDTDGVRHPGLAVDHLGGGLRPPGVEGEQRPEGRRPPRRWPSTPGSVVAWTSLRPPPIVAPATGYSSSLISVSPWRLSTRLAWGSWSGVSGPGSPQLSAVRVLADEPEVEGLGLGLGDAVPQLGHGDPAGDAQLEGADARGDAGHHGGGLGRAVGERGPRPLGRRPSRARPRPVRWTGHRRGRCDRSRGPRARSVVAPPHPPCGRAHTLPYGGRRR